MNEREIMEIFTKIGAYQQGHFKLSSGLHSGAYLQCALVLQDPVLAARLCGVLAEKFVADAPDIVVGPAMGGVVLAYELARALNARAIFTERDKNGKMALRRGFMVSPKNKVLIAEDVLTTGGSVKEVIKLLEEESVRPLGVACLVNRSSRIIDFGGIKCESLIKLDIPTFEEAECPLCQEGMPITKPGSRK
ncbi:MAG: orotate phosphoribosyltransferase [Candidatus Omnitrophota bacterium]|jgi:orotate phosphoribosyltransferase